MGIAWLCSTTIWLGATAMAAQDAGVRLEADGDGGFRCTTSAYQAAIGADGRLSSLQAGGTELLGSGCGFVHGGAFLPFVRATQTAPDTVVAEGAPKDPATAVAGSPCPLEARVTYRFLPDHLELLLEQSRDPYGGFAWVPSQAVTGSRDALTDHVTLPAGPFAYGQTDPRWTTTGGPVLRFDFGVWQRGFANANWSRITTDGRTLSAMSNTVPAARPMTVALFTLAQPEPKDALTFDISAASPDFLLPGGQPVRFDITVTNAGPTAVAAGVRFEVRDYLTQEPVAARRTPVELPAGGTLQLPTDLTIDQPAPYRGAIVVEQAGQAARSFWWLFTYDFQHYAPATTRPPDFAQFWQDALAESAALPLEAQMTLVPEKGNAACEGFRISFATLAGRRIYGWYARPKAPGRYPAQVRFPSSGIYPLPGPELAADRCTLWIQIHGFDVDLSNLPAGDDPGKRYWTAGIASPQTSMWRTIDVSLVRAVDFMLAQPEVDPARVAVVGGSQGGGLAMIAAALDHRIAFAKPHHSGLPRLDWTVKYAPGYWPFGMEAKPEGQGDAEFLRTLSYFDPANFTQDIQCPIVAEVGLMDTVTAAGNQICALAHVPPGLLYLICSPWAMHGAGSRDAGLAEGCYARFLRGEPPFAEPTNPGAP